MDTLTIVKENKVNIEVPQRDAHKERVLQTIGKADMLQSITDIELKDLKEQGFTFVGKDIEAKFAYKAGIDGSYSVIRQRAKLFITLNLVLGVLLGIGAMFISIIRNHESYWWMFGSIVPMFGVSLILYMIFRTAGLYDDLIINYVGDIPEFVMDNMQKTQMAGVKKFMVYSCEPLPTEELLAKTDPVMIGWLDDDNTGVVIGIWDRDKEVTI